VAHLVEQPRVAARAPIAIEMDEPTIERRPHDPDATVERPRVAAPAPFVAEEAPIVASRVFSLGADAEPSPPVPAALDFEPKAQFPAPQPVFEREPTPTPAAPAPPPAPMPDPAPTPPPASEPIAVEPHPQPAPPAPRPTVDPADDSSRWVAPPPAEARPTTRRSTAWVLFAAVFIIAMVGVVLLLRSKGILGGQAPTPTTTAKPKVSAAPAETTPSASASAAAAPASAAAPEASAAAPDSSAVASGAASADAAPADIPAPPKDPKALSPQQGYLVVKTGRTGVDVYIQGAKVGAINAPLEVACGTKFTSLGKLEAGAFVAVGEGKAVKIDCQALTTVEFP